MSEIQDPREWLCENSFIQVSQESESHFELADVVYQEDALKALDLQAKQYEERIEELEQIAVAAVKWIDFGARGAREVAEFNLGNDLAATSSALAQRLKALGLEVEG